MKWLAMASKIFTDTWTEYWFRPAPLGDLAICRIVIVGFQLFHMVSQDWITKFRALSSLPDALYDPLPILHLLVSPFGWTFRPPFGTLALIFWLTFAVGVLTLVGFKTRPSFILFALGSTFMHAYLYSYKDFHHPPGIMVIGLTALALSSPGKRFSIDHWLATRAKGINLSEHSDAFARWPLLLVQWIFVFAYFSAAKFKLAVGGFDWMNGYTLQYFLASDGIRRGIELGIWFSQFHALAILLSMITIFFEASFFVVLIFPNFIWLSIPMGIMLHTGMYLTLGANFFQWIALYSVFIPWEQLFKSFRSMWTIAAHNFVDRLVSMTPILFREVFIRNGK